MKGVTIFNNIKFGSIEVYYQNGKEYFNANQVAELLGYARPNDTIRTRCKGAIQHSTLKNNGGYPLKLIPEGDLYRLIIGSQLPTAEEFEKWIFDEVLPTIRKTFTLLENIEFKGNIDNLVYSKNGKPITTSKIIAEYTGKQHTHILRDIKEEIEKLEKINPNLDTSIIINDFTKTEYLDSYGRSQVNYELGEMATMQLLLKYSAEHRAKFIIMFMEMKNTLMNMFKVKLLEEVLPQDNRLRQYVYIIENCDTSRIKIGVGQDPENRIKQLQTGSDSELSLVYRSNLCSNAFEVEKFMHDNFNDYHIRGEWFEVDKTLVINELERQNFVLKSEFIKELGLKDTIFDNFNIQNV